MVYILCNPNSPVNLREGPSKKSDIGGIVFCGDELPIDNVEKGVWSHTTLTLESADIWIHSGYITWNPVEVKTLDAVTNVGKLRCYNYIGGKVIHRLKKGTKLVVYAHSTDWAITNKGYIKTKFIDFIDDGGIEE